MGLSCTANGRIAHEVVGTDLIPEVLQQNQSKDKSRIKTVLDRVAPDLRHRDVSPGLGQHAGGGVGRLGVYHQIEIRTGTAGFCNRPRSMAARLS